MLYPAKRRAALADSQKDNSSDVSAKKKQQPNNHPPRRSTVKSWSLLFYPFLRKELRHEQGRTGKIGA